MNETHLPQSPEWDSATYHKVSEPHMVWGAKVLDKLVLHGDETVLDAGCGTGKLTAKLIERLPLGRVVALDVSKNMLDTAAEHLNPRFGERVELVRADLLALPTSGAFEAGFDGVFSTATFHWVLDHDALFRGLHRVLRPGGWLCAQCGGGPNLSRLMTRVEALCSRLPFSKWLGGFTKPCFYSSAETAAENLKQAGFADIHTDLEYAPATLDSGPAFMQFVSTVILRHYLERLPDDAVRENFLAELAKQAALDSPPYELDYWRLNLQARKPPEREHAQQAAPDSARMS